MAKSNSVKYVRVPPKFFQNSKGDNELEPFYLPGNPNAQGIMSQGPKLEEVNFIEGVKILRITEV